MILRAINTVIVTSHKGGFKNAKLVYLNLSSMSSICKVSPSRGEIDSFMLEGFASGCLMLAATFPLMLVIVVDGVLQEQKFVELSPYAEFG